MKESPPKVTITMKPGEEWFDKAFTKARSVRELCELIINNWKEHFDTHVWDEILPNLLPAFISTIDESLDALEQLWEVIYPSEEVKE